MMSGFDQEYKSWEPLSEIAQMAKDGEAPTLSQLSEWARKRDRNGFPQPKQVQGKFHFYDPDEVFRWIYLHKKATKNMQGGRNLNGQRQDS